MDGSAVQTTVSPLAATVRKRVPTANGDYNISHNTHQPGALPLDLLSSYSISVGIRDERR